MSGAYTYVSAERAAPGILVLHSCCHRTFRLVIFSVMKRLFSWALAALSLPVLSCAQNPQDSRTLRDVQTTAYNNSPVSQFDLTKYLGTWYEIARFDHSFEKGMENVMAEYLLREDGMIDVVNSGWKDGKYKVANGKAKQPDPLKDPAHLAVSFFLFFFSDYNVMMVDDDYQVALVGSKSPKFLWILSKSPEVSDTVLDCVLEEASGRGYDIDDLIWVDQSYNIREGR